MIGNYEGTLSRGGAARCGGGPLCYIFQAPPERARNLRDNRGRPLRRKRASVVDAIRQRSSGEVRHHEVHLIADRSEVRD